MASTHKISNRYSSTLDAMTRYIRVFLSRDNTIEAQQRAIKGVQDFCYHNSAEFTREFVRRVGLSNLDTANFPTHSRAFEDFVQHLTELDGECVFLLKDTFLVMRQYQKETAQGFGVLVNRAFLCQDGDEEDYFVLVNLVYSALRDAPDLPAFLQQYQDHFDRLLAARPHFAERAQEIAAYIGSHHSGNRIVWVDFGFQFTFSLFCRASIQRYHKQAIAQDFYSFTAYPWLQEFFQDKYFSCHNEHVLDWEIEGIRHYQESLEDKAAGILVGFAIGDALGFPVAGINRSDVPRFLNAPLVDFTKNTGHPFFEHLHPGQYTDNTRLLMLTAVHLVHHRGLAPSAYARNLIDWGHTLEENGRAERWAGPTALKAVQRLMAGTDYNASGSTTTDSSSASYRTVPLGLFYRPFSRSNAQRLSASADTAALMTHNSALSKAGAVMVALAIADLVSGVLPEATVFAAVDWVEGTPGTSQLVARMREAVEFSKTKSVEEARHHFGTGSPIWQTLPLAIYCFLKHQDDFAAAVLAAANSYRDDTPADQERLMGLSWVEQLQAARGGNTDGVAGLTGAFSAAYQGLHKIPLQFHAVEDFEKLTSLGKLLV